MLALVGAIICKVSHNLSSSNSPRARQLLVIIFGDFGDWAAHQTVLSVAINSYSEILAALQT